MSIASFRRLGTRAAALAAASIAVVAAPVSAQSPAHINVDEDAVEAGAQALLGFTFTHGCAGSPTTEIRIQMPESVPIVAPTLNANWDVDKVTADLDEPVEGPHGEQVTARVTEVVYTARQPVPDGYRDELVLAFTAPDLPGETVYFPTIQSCEEGEHAWIEVPAEGEDPDDLESPAPSIAIVDSEDSQDH